MLTARAVSSLISELAQRTSYSELAKEIGVTEDELKQWAAGKRAYSPNEIWKLARFSSMHGFFDVLPVHGIPPPETWKLVPLDICCDIMSGSLSYTDFLNMASSDVEDSVECMGVKVSDMNLAGNERRFVTATQIKHLSEALACRKLIPPNTVVFPKRGAAIATNKKRLTTTWTVLDPNLIGLCPKESLDAEFLFYWSQTLDLRKITDPGPTPQLNKKDLIPILMPVPSDIEEQRKIAGVLGLVQRALEQQERLVALTTELKKALLHQLFTQGLRGEPQKQTEIGPMPQSWELGACDELCEMITVGVVVKPASHYVESGVPAFRSMNVREDRLEVTELVYFSQETNDTILAKSKLRTGDVLIVRTGYPGTSCVVPEEYDGANCIDLVIARPRLKVIQSGFLSRFFNSDAGKRQAVSAKHGLAQQHLNVGAVKRTVIPVPPLDEQREIDDALATVERKLALHVSKHAALTALFRTLLHQLMTAQIRVHNLNLPELESL